MSKHAKVELHVVSNHHLYRRCAVLLMATIAVLFMAHYLEVMFATVNIMHFLEVDDVLARYGF